MFIIVSGGSPVPLSTSLHLEGWLPKADSCYERLVCEYYLFFVISFFHPLIAPIFTTYKLVPLSRGRSFKRQPLKIRVSM